ncbi:DUF1015 domain-containing protein [Oscillospiraceae bacterium PP1C4]
MSKVGFSPADILVPKDGKMSGWSVVACDQYTSEPEYWERVKKTVGDAPSTLHMILPEVYLEEKGVSDRINGINKTMQSYLDGGIFRKLSDSYLYVERTLAPGKVRHGLIGKLDLEEYDYAAGTQSLVRPTEGTVESRLPPRIKVRENAPLETPHIMVLIDDFMRGVIEPLATKTAHMEQVYGFDLMENGGNIKGWAVDSQTRDEIDAALFYLSTGLTSHHEKFVQGKEPLLIAVGDGNHSLATAKACFEQLKNTMPKEQWKNHPARYALVELVNVHDAAMEFEPIHRVLFGVDSEKVLAELKKYYRVSLSDNGGQSFEYIAGSKRERLYIEEPPSQLAVGTLQQFIDWYLAKFGGSVDYIHGDEVVEHLAKNEGTIGFLLPVMKKSQLFPTVLLDGALPRKTFSMGHAYEKRYYLECREIR